MFNKASDNGTKPPPPPKPDTPEQQAAKLEAFARLERLGGAEGQLDPSHYSVDTVTFHKTMHNIYLKLDQERYDEIKKNREILGLSTDDAHMGMPNPADRKVKPTV